MDTVRTAKVSIVDRVVDASSGTFGVRLELPNPGHRLPGGLKCRVRFNIHLNPTIFRFFCSQHSQRWLETTLNREERCKIQTGELFLNHPDFQPKDALPLSQLCRLMEGKSEVKIAGFTRGPGAPGRDSE